MKTLLKNLRLIDSSNEHNGNLVDIVIVNDIITEIGTIEDGSYDKEFDYEGKYYVSAGWIDLHVHCFQDVAFNGIDADRIGVESGVVCLCDAGSSGSANVDRFYDLAKTKRTIIKSWLNIASTGLATKSELRDISKILVEESITKINQYPEFIIGLKLRASASVMGEDMITPFVRCHEIQDATNLPVMVHIGNNPPNLDDVINQLRAGDVVTHCFHGKEGNNIIVDNSIRQSVLNQRNNNVYYDVGHGEASFSFRITEEAKKLNFDPDSISTDLHVRNIDGPVYSLANVMTKFLMLGYTLEQVVDYVTLGPAEIMNSTEFGKIRVGGKAHLTLFSIYDETRKMTDSEKNDLVATKLIKPHATFINGKYERAIYEDHL